MVEARIRVRHKGCFTERLHGPLNGVQLSSERDSDVLVLHGAENGQLEGILTALSAGRLRRPEVIDRAPGSVVLRVRSPAHSVVSDVAAAGCTILWPALFANGEESYTVLAPSHEELDALVKRLGAHGTVTLERVEEVPPSALNVSVPLADITTALTERQLVILQRAIAEGYYDSPRRTSTEALAAEFGVTRSTLEEHLRKAERRVLEGFAGVLLAQPVIARAAARRPGRPARAPGPR
ncbi:MAG TPA: helix-turn-helix domain-containing protein [Candidatus Thermoplasmatota archaeon]|nr:helix-turn-helix domain-containing protein [Candidatus Thermoplasmatota archaeon]